MSIEQAQKGTIVFAIQLLALALADDDPEGIALAQRSLKAMFPLPEDAHVDEPTG